MFTVVIPVYNRADVIAGTVASVLAQTFQDFEIVVIDDGSKDDPEPAIAAIGDPRIRYIRQDNAGANAARNRGIDAARGRFVALLDSDDRFVPEHLERTAAVLAEKPDHLVFSRIVVDRGGGKTFLKPPRAPYEGEDMGEYYMCRRGFVQTSTVALATETARRVRYLEGLASCQDADFAIRLAADGVRFHMIETPGAIWKDQADTGRVSSVGLHCDNAMRWAEQSRGVLTERAYHGFRGWFVAKAMSRMGQKRQALALYLTALRHRCYSPETAGRILLQVLLTEGGYRRVADRAVALGKT
jgi:glycosyltransferase involved in cell wall biosynthesis